MSILGQNGQQQFRNKKRRRAQAMSLISASGERNLPNHVRYFSRPDKTCSHGYAVRCRRDSMGEWCVMS